MQQSLVLFNASSAILTISGHMYSPLTLWEIFQSAREMYFDIISHTPLIVRNMGT